MANLGYIQVLRNCQHNCVFCSNPVRPLASSLEAARVLVDDLADRGYHGVILTGGEPTLHDDLPAIIAYARHRNLEVRLITNGSRGGDDAFYAELFRAGLQLAHVSIYSCRTDVEAQLRRVSGTLTLAHASIEGLHRAGVVVNVNTVINCKNADHLDETVKVLDRLHPHLSHYVWNNLDPSMGLARSAGERFAARLADMELSLLRATRYLRRRHIGFRIERVPLCYMTEMAWASTETRKIVKQEERVVHFLDEKGTVRQSNFQHAKYPACSSCSLRDICAGLFEPGNGYDPGELHAVFVDPLPVVHAVFGDDRDSPQELVAGDTA